ncbi:MAG: SHOCT domain-containing protein [Patescibacteria group bacterium]|nr:SHOCT domain-containing protein [Patescibacteria group bacterium]
MKKLPFIATFVFVFGLALPTLSSAQGMMGFSSSSPDTAAIQSQQQEEQAGKNFLDNLSNKTVACSQLTDADFEKIGEYLMGQAIGNTAEHIAMNNMMTEMMGVQGEEQMHIAWGKRGSGCDTSAAFPTGSDGWMSTMMGGWTSPFSNNSTNNMMGFGTFGGFGWIVMILWWVLIIAGIVALTKWIAGRSHDMHHTEKSALDVLKERYAKGEIDKKEFEEKRRDLQ